MKTSTLLKKSLKVLEENGWTQGPMARNKYRHEVKPNSKSAVRFCSIGAVLNVLDLDGKSWDLGPDYTKAISALNEMSPHFGIVSHNESSKTKFEDIQKVFKKAIKATKAQGN